MFLYCLRQYPELKLKIKEILSKFLESEENRNKNNLSNLGCILAFLTVSDDYKFTDIAQTYFY